MTLLILSMSNDGEVIFRIGKYTYCAWIDTAYYGWIKKWRHRRPGMIINFIKKKWKVERYDEKLF
jgi:hypothetical protein